jgi:phage gp36-like protein
MTITTAFASLADLLDRHPEQLTLLAADEITGTRDDGRVERACEDASAEIRGILFARYSAADLAALDPDSAAILRVYAMDIALYRISVSFARTSEILKERYDASVARLTAIAKGAGGLVVLGSGSGSGTDPGVGPISSGGVVIEAPERMFTRERFGRL